MGNGIALSAEPRSLQSCGGGGCPTPPFLKTDLLSLPKKQGSSPHRSGGQSSHITSSYSFSLLGLAQIKLGLLMVVEVRGSGWLRDKNLSLLLHPMTPVCRHHRGWGALAPQSSPAGLSAVIKEQKTLRRPPGLGLTFLLGQTSKRSPCCWPHGPSP